MIESVIVQVKHQNLNWMTTLWGRSVEFSAFKGNEGNVSLRGFLRQTSPFFTVTHVQHQKLILSYSIYKFSILTLLIPNQALQWHTLINSRRQTKLEVLSSRLVITDLKFVTHSGHFLYWLLGNHLINVTTKSFPTGNALCRSWFKNWGVCESSSWDCHKPLEHGRIKRWFALIFRCVISR